MATTASAQPAGDGRQQPQVQPCRYKVGKTLGAGSYSVVKECVHIDTGRYYAAKVINKRLMSGREHMVLFPPTNSLSLCVCFVWRSASMLTICAARARPSLGPQ